MAADRQNINKSWDHIQVRFIIHLELAPLPPPTATLLHPPPHVPLTTTPPSPPVGHFRRTLQNKYVGTGHSDMTKVGGKLRRAATPARRCLELRRHSTTTATAHRCCHHFVVDRDPRSSSGPRTSTATRPRRTSGTTICSRTSPSPRCANRPLFARDALGGRCWHTAPSLPLLPCRRRVAATHRHSPPPPPPPRHAQNDSIGRVRYQLLEKMLQPCGAPPAKQEDES